MHHFRERWRALKPNRLSSGGGLNAAQSHRPFKEGTLQRNCQMPTASDYFPTPTSKYFRAGDFTKEIVGTIQSVDRTEFKNDDGSAAAKPVLHFQDLTQALVLNKTNFTALALMLGENTNDWIGAKVALYPSRVDFKGKTMPTIKVRRPQKAAAAAASSGHPFNDDVPF
jgi:hypothetical protein